MSLNAFQRRILLPLLASAALLLNGCSSIVSSATAGMAEDLSASILDQEDPELVREAVPAFLLLLDSMVRSSPDNPATLGAAGELYAAYGIAFNDDPERAKVLTRQARAYGRRSLCAADKGACGLEDLPFDEYEAAIRAVDAKAAEALYSYSVGSLAYIRAHSADFVALADLPKIETALAHLLALGVDTDRASVLMYLGILNTLRPPALGGQPEKGRGYFEEALALAGDRDLSIKVEYARGYARLLYERELHDQLLNEVLTGEVRQPGYTLMNSLAHQQARELLDSADEYF
ncbi:MAG: TRAP transporter TatT component family protein [Gammaproteobacteria bacterium]